MFYWKQRPRGLRKLASAAVPFPSIIFLDLHMPRINGRQMLLHLKNDPSFNIIPVIICSTSSNETEMAELKALSATYYIVKPSDDATLKMSFSTFCLPYNVYRVLFLNGNHITMTRNFIMQPLWQQVPSHCFFIGTNNRLHFHPALFIASYEELYSTMPACKTTSSKNNVMIKLLDYTQIKCVNYTSYCLNRIACPP